MWANTAGAGKTLGSGGAILVSMFNRTFWLPTFLKTRNLSQGWHVGAVHTCLNREAPFVVGSRFQRAQREMSLS